MSSLALILLATVPAVAQPAPDAPSEPVAEPAPVDEPVQDAPDVVEGDVAREDTAAVDDEGDALDEAAEPEAPPATTAGAAVEAAEVRSPPAPAQFLAGNDVEIDEALGDVIAMGNSVRVTSRVGDNAVLMGRQVTLKAPTDGDVLAMGQIIKVDSAIGGDLYALGAEVQLTEDGSVGGTILGTAQRIVVERSDR